MTKFERAIEELKKLPPESQEAWASMILAQLGDQSYKLTAAQMEEVKRRLAEKNPATLTLEAAEKRIAKLLG